MDAIRSKPEKDVTRIALFGNFGTGNLGNECTLSAILANLRKSLPDASFTCICSAPDIVELGEKVHAVPIRKGNLPQKESRLTRLFLKLTMGLLIEISRWQHAYAVARDHDLLIMSGTGMLSDLGIRPFGLHYDILRWSVAARLAGCRLLYVSVGVGPLKSVISQWIVKAALSIADFRSYRDEFSRKYLESIRFDASSDPVYPDLAFSLPSVCVRRQASRREAGKCIALGVITHSRRRSTAADDESVYRHYVETMASFAQWLLDNGYSIRIVVGDVRYDQRAVLDILALLEPHMAAEHADAIRCGAIVGLQDLVTALDGADIVVASRFHNVLLSLMLSKPVLAISFHEKVDALMAAMGLEEYCDDLETIEFERLTRQFSALVADAANISESVSRTTLSYRGQLDEQYERLIAFAGDRTHAFS